MSERPLVSVIIPSYNHEQYVEEAVRSVWNQTYRPIELIVVDDASQDRSVEILTRLKKESPIPMEVLVNEKNLGLPATLNRGLEEITGEYVVIFASDDRLPKKRVENHIQMFTLYHHDVDIVYGDMEGINAEGQRLSKICLKPAKKVSLKSYVLGKSPLRLQTMTIRRKVFEIVGNFDPDVRLEDVDFYLRCFLYGIRMKYFPHIAVQYRRHDRQTVHRRQWLVGGMYEIYKKYEKCNLIPKRYLKLLFDRSYVYHKFWSNPGRLASIHFLVHWARFPDDMGSLKSFIYHLVFG